MPAVQIGLECCSETPPAVMRNGRFGLLCNHASVDFQHRPACEVLAAAFPDQLVCVFAPQHGFWGEQQANMDETPHQVYEPLGVPLYSLYYQQRYPTEAMLEGLDCLVIDLQDVGTRVYTFVWTMSHCLEACANRDIPVVVLDRPNPLGGRIVEGPRIQPGFESFVGRFSIPMRHGLTIGEIASWINRQIEPQVDLHVVKMRGWHGRMLWSDCHRMWIGTSPNLPRVESLWLYPGQVLLEGTNLSEGRGTTTPFELLGAPYIDPFELARELSGFQLPGIQTVPVRFRPTFDKWADRSCGGVAWRITDPEEVRSYAASVAAVACVKRLWPHDFSWLPPPYEYESEKMPIDILSGSTELRLAIDGTSRVRTEDIQQLAATDLAAWGKVTEAFQLYDR